MKKLLTIILVITLCMAMIIPAYAEETHPARLVDDADLLTQSEETQLVQKLDEISNRQNLDVVIVTTDSLGGKTAQAYADDYFDYNGYGMGEDDDGIIFVISMGEREWAISTHAYGIEVFTDYVQNKITDVVVPYLGDGDYYEAFDEFATLCDDYITKAVEEALNDDDEALSGVTGNSPDADVDGDVQDDEESEPNYSPISSVVLAAVVSGVLNMRGKRKKVNMKAKEDAADYWSDFKIIEENDVYLRTDRRVVKIEENRKKSTLHKSSSRRTHGGSSGKF